MQITQIFGLNLTPFVMYMAADMNSVIRPFANVAQPNQLALLLCFGLASIWYLYQDFRVRAGWAVLMVVFLLFGIALTQSRIGWVIVPLLLLLSTFSFVGNRRLPALVALGILLIYVGFVLTLPWIAELIGFSVGAIEERVGGRSERMVLWAQAWEMAKQHPWFGVGWFGFGAEQVKIAADFSATTYAEHSHNIVLNFAAELGFPFTIVFFFGLVYWLWKTCIAKGAAKNKEVGFALMCFVAVGVHSMVEFPLWYANVLLPIAILMGAVHQHRWPSSGVQIRPSLSAGIAVLGLVGCVLVTLDYQRVVNGFVAFRQAENMASVDVEKIRRPEWTLLPDYFDYFAVLRMVPKAGMSGEEIAFFERMSRRFGYVHVLSRMAEVYALNGELAKAQRTMLTLQRLHPYSYPEYFDYWQKLAGQDVRYKAVFDTMLPRDAQ